MDARQVQPYNVRDVLGCTGDISSTSGTVGKVARGAAAARKLTLDAR